MQKTIQLLQTPFESSCSATPEFNTYARTFKREVKSVIESIGGELVSFSKGHFEVSGFFKVGEKFYYFSQSDLRYFVGQNLLLRTAKSEKDYTGGSNHFVEMGSEMFSQLPV